MIIIFSTSSVLFCYFFLIMAIHTEWTTDRDNFASDIQFMKYVLHRLSAK